MYVSVFVMTQTIKDVMVYIIYNYMNKYFNYKVGIIMNLREGKLLKRDDLVH